MSYDEENVIPKPKSVMVIDSLDLGVKDFPDKLEFLKYLLIIEGFCNHESIERLRCDCCSMKLKPPVEYTLVWNGDQFTWDSLLSHMVSKHSIRPPKQFVKAVLEYARLQKEELEKIRDFLEPYYADANSLEFPLQKWELEKVITSLWMGNVSWDMNRITRDIYNSYISKEKKGKEE